MPLPVIVDCDTGIDDAFALTYLACRKEVEIAGVVSTGGNVPVAAVQRNNLVLTGLLGLDVPVARGAAAPLVEPPMFAEDTHGPGGLGHARVPDPVRTSDPRSGAQLWVDLAREHPGELVGLVLGPHTNLALALEIDPELPRLLRRLHVMGGALHHRGNTGPTSEWNVAVDPEAAQRVLAAFATAPQLPVLGALQGTEAVRFEAGTLAEVEDIAAVTAHPVARILADALRFYYEFHEADGFGWMAHVHDPVVAIHAVTGRFARTVPLAVDVELQGTLTRGQTVADVLGRWGRPPTLEALADVEAGPLVEHLLGTLREGLASR